MLRRLYADQPDTFAFTPENLAWAQAQITKYPKGREASAIIPLLWRAQEQEGWLTRPAIEHVSDMLGMAYIRALEVASFYFMFQLHPVGSLAHFQICGTLSCMICGAEDLVAVCREKIAPKPHQVSEDGQFSWEEVECLGACANAPMAQIGKDYYEDLTAERFSEIIDEIAAGKVPTPGPQNGRFAAEPLSGLTSLKDANTGQQKINASAQLATDIGDSVKRIDGAEVPMLAPWGDQGGRANSGEDPIAKPANRAAAPAALPSGAPSKVLKKPAPKESSAKPASSEKSKKKTESQEGDWTFGDDKDTTPGKSGSAKPRSDAQQPKGLSSARDGKADDLKMIRGVGPKLEKLLNSLGFFHLDQIAAWSGSEIAWVDENLQGFKGRVTRDDWVAQAKTLASGEETEFSQRAQKDGIYKGDTKE